jgi:hypothetical protein
VIVVNTDMVNAGSAYFMPQHFCESFADSGRISRLQNPFKYTRRFNINQNHAGKPVAPVKFTSALQWLSRKRRALTLPQGASAKLVRYRMARPLAGSGLTGRVK